MSRFPLGQPIRRTTTVRDVNGNLANAGALSLTVQKPDATQQVYSSPTNDGTGLYHQDIPVSDLTQLGHYMEVWTATGANAGVARGDFDVFDPFEPAVLSLQDAKQTVNIPDATITYDSELQLYVDVATVALEAITGGPAYTRSFSERVEVTQFYSALVLRKRPVVAVTSISDIGSGTSLPITDIEVDTNSGIVRRKIRLPFLSWGPYYQVVYTAGWGTVIPPAFGLAARIIVSHLWQTQRGPGLAVVPGMEDTILPGMAYAIPNRALEVMRPYTSEAYV
jgi:hypothetical protein